MNEQELQNTEAQLLSANLRLTIDTLRSEIRTNAVAGKHRDDLVEHRLNALEAQAKDYETRIRTLQETATQFKLMASLATGGGLLSLIALIRTLTIQ